MRAPATRRSPVHGLSPQAGIRERRSDGWPVVDGAYAEFAFFVFGRTRLTDAATQTVIEVEAGNVVILPPGWSGRWDVVETARKVYVIY